MPLFRIIKINKHGKVTTDEIIYNNTTNLSYTPEEDIVSVWVSLFKYKVKGTVTPSLLEKDGKKWIVPQWKEVHPLTSLSDIQFIAPQKRPRADIKVENTGSDGSKYKTTYNTTTGKFKCDCMGFFRSRGNCKHVKSLKEKLAS